MNSKLTLKDVIETLVRYDVEHCRFPHNYMNEAGYDVDFIEGMVLDDRKLILLNKELGDELMKETIIHELIHTKHYRLGDLRGINNIETQVQKETKLTYNYLYRK